MNDGFGADVCYYHDCRRSYTGKILRTGKEIRWITGTYRKIIGNRTDWR